MREKHPDAQKKQNTNQARERHWVRSYVRILDEEKKGKKLAGF